MLRRRNIQPGGGPGQQSAVATAAGPVREVAWAVEERVVWGAADLLRGVFDAVKWFFERLAWTVERRLVWPVQEGIGDSSPPLRAAGATAAVVVAIGAALLGLALASDKPGSPSTTVAVQTAAPTTAVQPVAHAAPPPEVLRGAAPNFTPLPAEARASATEAAAPEPSAKASEAKVAETPGPAALEVARRFAAAFVLYETGRGSSDVRTAFGETATPRLAEALLKRPPRLPATVEVPKAKVLNLVPGPREGDTYTVSVSLLRVGVTSELRIDMRREAKSGDWRVTDVLG